MAYFISVTGGTASGKTSTCLLIKQQLRDQGVDEGDITIISLDSFYRGVEKGQKPEDINFDHPSSMNFDSLYLALLILTDGQTAKIPNYDFVLHQPNGSTAVKGKGCIIVEGILVLYDERVRELFDMNVFVETPSDIRLIRRIRRDMKERGRTLESVLAQCEKTVIPSYDQFIEPTKKYADVIIPRGKTNLTAIAMMVNQITKSLSR